MPDKIDKAIKPLVKTRQDHLENIMPDPEREAIFDHMCSIAEGTPWLTVIEENGKRYIVRLDALFDIHA